MCNHSKYSQFLLASMLLIVLHVSGCAVRPKLQNSEVGDEPTGAGDSYVSHQVETEPSEIINKEYRLGFGDVLAVKFFNNKEFDEEVVVRPDGRISLQRVGDITVSGMTPVELTGLISKQYEEILREPEVTVIVKEFGGSTVYVLGEVKTPGGYPLQRSMTTLRALTVAGGPTEEANLGSVMLIRIIDKDRISAKRINLNLASLAKDPALDINVQAYDIVYVPKTFIANLRTFLTQVYDSVLPPLDLYTRYIWYSKAWN